MKRILAATWLGKFVYCLLASTLLWTGSSEEAEVASEWLRGLGPEPDFPLSSFFSFLSDILSSFLGLLTLLHEGHELILRTWLSQ